MTESDECSGGDCSDVEDKLKDVQQSQATSDAFAAILGHGSVVTWGHEVQQIQASTFTFAAILGDVPSPNIAAKTNVDGECHSLVQDGQGARALPSEKVGLLCHSCRWVSSDVTWGAEGSGVDCSGVEDQLKDVQQIQATSDALLPFWEMGLL